jgi:Delta7-sterol 5-desaturase
MTPRPLPFELHGFAATSALLFAVVLLRYLLVAGPFYWIFYHRRFGRGRKIRAEFPPLSVIKTEIGYSVLTSALFGVSGAALLYAWKNGYTLLYSDVSDYGWTWLALSFPVLALLHETYFYWTHRLIHHPKLFRLVHRVHHISKNPTPWAAFSFHPTEALLQAVAVPLFVCFVPTHHIALVFYLMAMTVLSVINHLGFEIYPRGAERTFVGKSLINATHHYLHHHRARGNFGLYFTFWDRWMGTQATDTHAVYREVTTREPAPTRRRSTQAA